MRRALLLTAFDRPGYLRRVVASWARVRELQEWHLRLAVEPSDVQEGVVALAGSLPGAEVVVNGSRLGVARNPYHHLDTLFEEEGYDFVARTEDDLVVADDVLRLLEHCASGFAEAPDVAAVCAFSPAPPGADPAAVHRTTAFSPWLWGTWRDRWRDVIGPTWDHDYSTWNDSPGFESGWDWNLNTRVLPARGLTTVAPAVSRVQNIGVVGQHGTAENHETAPGFRADLGRVAYRYVE